MKPFTIPGLDIEFFQHSSSQAISSDTFELYTKVREAVLKEKGLKKEWYAISPYSLKIMDLGTGCGIILLMLAKDFHDLCYTGIEILHELTEIAQTNIDRLSEYVKKNLDVNIVNADYCKLDVASLKDKKFDFIVSNPPYYPVGFGNISSNYEKAVSRFEIMSTMKGLLSCIKTYLNGAGKSFVMYPVSRVKELEIACKELSLMINTTFASNKKLIFEITHA